MAKDSNWHNEKCQRCIQKYSSKTKMKSVRDWRKRITGCRAKQSEIAATCGIRPERLSEYMRLLFEPADDIFYKIESEIRKAEKQAEVIF